MFKNFKNTFKIISFLSLVLLTTFFIIFIKPDATVAATFSVPGSARSGVTGQHIFTLKNHSKALLRYDFTELSEGRNPVLGSIKPGQYFVTPAMDTDVTLEVGNISSVIAIAGAPNPSFRFWSGGVEIGFFQPKTKDQYINLLEGNGYKVTKNTEEISEITGNGFRITVDGGGVKDPNIGNIHIQVYNA